MLATQVTSFPFNTIDNSNRDVFTQKFNLTGLFWDQDHFDPIKAPSLPNTSNGANWTLRGETDTHVAYCWGTLVPTYQSEFFVSNVGNVLDSLNPITKSKYPSQALDFHPQPAILNSDMYGGIVSNSAYDLKFDADVDLNRFFLADTLLKRVRKLKRKFESDGEFNFLQEIKRRFNSYIDFILNSFKAKLNSEEQSCDIEIAQIDKTEKCDLSYKITNKRIIRILSQTHNDKSGDDSNNLKCNKHINRLLSNYLNVDYHEKRENSQEKHKKYRYNIAA